MNRAWLLVVGSLLLVGAACTDVGSDNPPDWSGGVPVVDMDGQTVGSADPDEMADTLEGGDPAEVRKDGEVVGHFGPTFIPLESPSK